jgi:hypothetical protein
MSVLSGEAKGNLSIRGDERVVRLILLHQDFDKDQMPHGCSKLKRSPLQIARLPPVNSEKRK